MHPMGSDAGEHAHGRRAESENLRRARVALERLREHNDALARRVALLKRQTRSW